MNHSQEEPPMPHMESRYDGISSNTVSQQVLAYARAFGNISSQMVHLHNAATFEFLYVSDHISSLLGYTFQELQKEKKTLLSLLTPATPREYILPLIQLSIRDGIDHKPQPLNLRIRHKNGSEKILQTQFTVFETDANGNPHILLCLSQEITQETQSITYTQVSDGYEIQWDSEILMAEAERMRHFGTWQMHLPTGRIGWTEGMYHIFGYSDPSTRPNIITLELIFSHVRPEERQKLWDEAHTNLAKGEDYQGEWIMVRRNGEHRVLLEQVRILKDADNRPVVVLGSTSDITEERQMANNLNKIEKLLHENERTFGFGSWEWSAVTNKIMWSDGTLLLFGLDPEEWRYKLTYEHSLTLVDPRDTAHTLQVMEKAIVNRQTYEIEFRPRHGTPERWLRSRGVPVYDTEGKLERIYGTTVDITAERKVLQKLRENEELLSTAEHLTRSGSWLWDIQKNEVTWSNGLWELLEYPPEERTPSVASQFYYEHIHPQDKAALEQSSANFQETGIRTASPIYRLITRSGQTIYVNNKLQIVEQDTKGKPLRVIGGTADVTHLKNIQMELEKKVEQLNHSNAELEQFAYIASHDLQEPLRKIVAFCNLLVRTYQPLFDETGLMYLDRIESAVRRMQHLISDLLDFSRISNRINPTEYSFERTDLNQIVRNALQDLELAIQQKGAHITLAELPTVEVIPSQLERLFLNLIGNSLKFSRPEVSPQIHIYTKPVDDSSIKKYSLNKEQNYVSIVVEDNGIGFEPEYTEQIFAIFRRLHSKTEYEGTGIGLATCRKIVETHQGYIKADGTPGRGACFSIILPIRQE
ncbi:PAS domain-containing protein [Cytophagaceae bacterium YF14B1]|uniref:histidine kinase n=1 Tax=Xanthocytophaga flava TaxID=3048013 RepID=A0AAE3QXU5_9BACT|nr:PAS domain-containing protein [Xanthocytophaga flavus]MDJ1485428.1 PAS domain-containing protein [Xanthocytophaga flavus]